MTTHQAKRREKGLAVAAADTDVDADADTDADADANTDAHSIVNTRLSIDIVFALTPKYRTLIITLFYFFHSIDQ